MKSRRIDFLSLWECIRETNFNIWFLDNDPVIPNLKLWAIWTIITHSIRTLTVLGIDKKVNSHNDFLRVSSVGMFINMLAQNSLDKDKYYHPGKDYFPKHNTHTHTTRSPHCSDQGFGFIKICSLLRINLLQLLTKQTPDWQWSLMGSIGNIWLDTGPG